MTDDEIQATIDRRLAEVEDRLPPRTLEPAARSRLVDGRPIPGRLGGRAWPGLLVVAAAALVVVFGVVGGSGGPGPGTAADQSLSAPASSPAPSASLVAIQRPTGPPPYETSFVDGLEVIRGDVAPERLILDRLGMSTPGQCLMSADITISLPDLAVLDALAEAAGIDEGWVDVPGFGRVLIGPSAERASRALDASILAVGNGGDMWVAVGASARQLVAFSTPAGRTYWRLTSMVRPCSPEPGGPR